MYGFNLTNSWAMQLIAFRQMENIGESMQFAYRIGRALKMPPYVFTPSSSGLNTKGSLSISVRLLKQVYVSISTLFRSVLKPLCHLHC